MAILFSVCITTKFSVCPLKIPCCHSPLQPEEGAPENFVLFPPQENQNDSLKVQCVYVYVCGKEKNQLVFTSKICFASFQVTVVIMKLKISICI